MYASESYTTCESASTGDASMSNHDADAEAGISALRTDAAAAAVLPMPLLRAPRCADDADFATMKQLIDDDTGWTCELTKSETRVWTRNVVGCDFHMVKMSAPFPGVEADVLYDVLLDPDYRRDWDSHMVASEDIGCLNVNNDIGYYAMSCPAPLKSRDFVLMRSWLDTGPMGEQMVLSRSVTHRDWPPKKGFVRANSYITGFVVRPLPGGGGCSLGYVALCDPQGALPPWLVNKVTHSLGPRMVKDLRKAAQGYVLWKLAQPHRRKPWRNPEEIQCPRITVEDCLAVQPTNGFSATPSIAIEHRAVAAGRRSLPATPVTERPQVLAASLDTLDATPQRPSTTGAAAGASTAAAAAPLTSSKHLLKFRKTLRLGRKNSNNNS